MNPDTNHHSHVWMAEMRNQSLGQAPWALFLQDIQKAYLKNAVGEGPGLDKFRSPCLNQLGERKKEKIPQDKKAQNKRTEPQPGLDPSPIRDKTKETLLHNYRTNSLFNSNSFSELFPNKFPCLFHHKNILKKKIPSVFI